MTINIGDVSISIPTAISNWANESEDNRAEFDGMIQSMMYAVNKAMKERNHVTPNPYQPLYDAQLNIAQKSGISKETVDGWISEFVGPLAKQAESGELNTDNETLMRILSAIYNN